jgi:hypothetical protein
MKILICLFLFQSFFYLSFCQPDSTKPNAADTVSKIIEQLPEFKAEQKRVDSIKKEDKTHSGHYGVDMTVAIAEKSKIANVLMIEDLKEVHKRAYLIKYDMVLKKVISIKKQY